MENKNRRYRRKELRYMSADEMFKELGYEKVEHNYAITGKIISYENDVLSPIDFMCEYEEIKIWHISIGVQELKAINKKVEELGWLKGDK